MLHDELFQQATPPAPHSPTSYSTSRGSTPAPACAWARALIHGEDRLVIRAEPGRVRPGLGRIARRRSRDLELELDPLAFDGIVSSLLDNTLRYGEPPVEIRVAGGASLRSLSRIAAKDPGRPRSAALRAFAGASRRRLRARRGRPRACDRRAARPRPGRQPRLRGSRPDGARFTFELPGERPTAAARCRSDEPRPSRASTQIEPCMRSASSRQMYSPSPVPPTPRVAPDRGGRTSRRSARAPRAGCRFPGRRPGSGARSPTRCDADLDAPAVGRVLDRVLDQVAEDLPQLLGVGRDRAPASALDARSPRRRKVSSAQRRSCARATSAASQLSISNASCWSRAGSQAGRR